MVAGQNKLAHSFKNIRPFNTVNEKISEGTFYIQHSCIYLHILMKIFTEEINLAFVCLVCLFPQTLVSHHLWLVFTRTSGGSFV